MPAPTSEAMQHDRRVPTPATVGSITSTMTR
jgi:hypothetical protein